MENWNWNTIWTAFAGIGTVGTLFLLSASKISGWFLKEQKRMRLNRFFRDKNHEGWHRYFIDEFNCLNVSNYIITYGEYTNHFPILFYRYQRIFFNKNQDVYINGIQVPIGYHTYKIISDYCIRLDIINDDTGDLKSVFIYKDNNVPSKIYHNRKIFKQITSWKYE